MKILELFAGTASVGNIFADHGHDVRTLDFDPQHNPTYCMDIMDFTPEVLEGWQPDIIWASPDCSCFSVASIGKYWNKEDGVYTPKDSRSVAALKMLEKTIEIIRLLKPKYFFIENPRGMMRKMECLEPFTRHTVTYCQYGDTRMKPTDIWTNCPYWIPRSPCKNGDSCHVAAPRGSKCGTQGIKGSVDRSRIPKQLGEEIYNAVKDNI